MSLVEAFLFATAAAYMAAALFSLLGNPPQQDIPPSIQAPIYFVLGSALTMAVLNTLPPLAVGILGGLYGFLSVSSFIGWPQKWYAYWKDRPADGSAAGQIAMGFWDLAISVCFFHLWLG